MDDVEISRIAGEVADTAGRLVGFTTVLASIKHADANNRSIVLGVDQVHDLTWGLRLLGDLAKEAANHRREDPTP